MRGQALLAGQGCRLGQVVLGHGVAVPGVFQAQQARAGKVAVVGFDGGGNIGQRHGAVCALHQRLGLNTAQHRSATTLVAVGVGRLADDVLVAAAAMGHQTAQIALRAGGHEQRGLKAQQRGNFFLQGVDRGVIAKHIVAQRRGHHGLAHGRGGLGDGIAAQINYFGHIKPGPR